MVRMMDSSVSGTNKMVSGVIRRWESFTDVYFSYFSVLNFELEALCMLGPCLTLRYLICPSLVCLFLGNTIVHWRFIYILLISLTLTLISLFTCCFCWFIFQRTNGTWMLRVYQFQYLPISVIFSNLPISSVWQNREQPLTLGIEDMTRVLWTSIGSSPAALLLSVQRELIPSTVLTKSILVGYTPVGILLSPPPAEKWRQTTPEINAACTRLSDSAAWSWNGYFILHVLWRQPHFSENHSSPCGRTISVWARWVIHAQQVQRC